MALWTNYVDGIHNAFGYLFANWVPDQPLALGDYGRFVDGVFHKDGTLKQLGIGVVLGPQQVGQALYDYHSENSSIAQLTIDGSGPASGAAVKAGLEIKFKDENSSFFNASGCSIREITNLASIGDAVRDKLHDGSWQYDLVVITTLITAKSTTAITSTSRDASIVLEAEGNVPKVDLASADLKLAVASQSNIGLKIITQPDCSPLFACHKAHWRLLGKPDWQVKHLRESVNEPSTAAQIDALRSSGEMEKEEFDFVELGKR
jgi:hypothetical protein